MNAIMRQLYSMWSLEHMNRDEAYDQAWEKYEKLLDAYFKDESPKTKLSDGTTEIAAVIEKIAFEAGLRMGINLMAEGDNNG
ncbi:hypothetical protein [Holdemania massiliensis]|uniref:hypothetical protein n=1 Tax=Holdemania massiliensis TaxID=1468449 RepID=UPI001F06E15D|nr:hypothetical protein [Holdemania massiliensis]MCH1940504.1 hypothetical protein [Holdemania massiliensis]